jgi:hypothetical protein
MVEITFEECTSEAMKENIIEADGWLPSWEVESFAAELEVSQNEPYSVDSYVAYGLSGRWCGCTEVFGQLASGPL